MAETIDICVCTYRRPQVVDTIASIAAQRLPPGIALRLVVADNEAEPAARDAVSAAAAAAGLALTYVHAPAGNISLARNACLDAATNDWIAFIDDDESAASDWLARLLDRRGGVEIVFGVSQAIYPSQAPAWIVSGDFHSNRLGPRDGAHNGYTCNVLLDRRFFARNAIRFDPALGRTGGEDTAFFLQAKRAGARFAYAPDAVVSEPVPLRRATFKWLWQRRFRSGQTDFQLRRQAGERVARRGVLAIPKIGYCMARAALAAPRPGRAAEHLLRGALHVGYLTSLFGRRTYEEYRS